MIEQEKRKTVLDVASALGIKVWFETTNPGCQNCDRCGFEVHKGELGQCDECGLENLCSICISSWNEKGHNCG